jgi:hypothetical protein
MRGRWRVMRSSVNTGNSQAKEGSKLGEMHDEYIKYLMSAGVGVHRVGLVG